MNRFRQFCTLLVVPLLFACSDGNNNNNNRTEPTVQPTQLRITHASPDAPQVNGYANGELARGPVDYKESSGVRIL